MNPPANIVPAPLAPPSFRVLHSFAEAEPDRQAWNELVRRTGADIYQTFEWCSIWWQHYGAKRQLHLLLFQDAGQLSGVVPAFIETLWLGPVRFKVAKLVGADFSLALCNLPVPAASRSLVLTQSLEYFLGQHRCDALVLGPLAGPAAGIDDLLRTGEAQTDLVGQSEALGNSCNTYFSLPATFADYLKTLDKKQRSNFKRMIEQSSKAHRVTFDTIAAPDRVGPEFEEFCQQHEAQWRADRRMGHFGDWPRAKEFNRDLIGAFAPLGQVRFYRILSDDQVVSSQYGFVLGDTVYWRLPARVRSAEWDRFSLGTVGLVKMIEALIGEGVRTIEGGRGHYGYKVHHGAHELPLRTLQFTRSGWLVALRARLFRAMAFVLEKGYYEGLFYRVGPYLKALQRPLWSVWIRSTW